MSSRLDRNLSLSKLRYLLRTLGIRSVKSDLEYALDDVRGIHEMHGMPDQIIMSSSTYASFHKAFSKD